MISYKPQLINLFKQIVFLFLLYLVCRILFYWFNHSYFQAISFSEWCNILVYGLRFDAFSIAATNALYILLCTLPFQFYYSNGYKKVTSAIFITTNAIAIALNFIDFAYFPFNQKRTTYDVSHFIFGGQTEFVKLIPHFLIAYWYLIILYSFCIWLLIKIHLRIRHSEKSEFVPIHVKKIILYLLVFLGLEGLTLLAVRGGLQKIPIVLMDAANYTKPEYIPIIINTPFSVLKSADLTELKPLHLFTDQELKKYYTPIHSADTGNFNSDNVCVIILESFSKEFTGISQRKSYTPFLDSLMSKATVYNNAISNGKTSINGIPSIIASIPCFLENQYLNSMYSNNTLQTLPNLLKTKGYTSVFFHGGTNGTMNFNSFSQLAGYDDYYGRSEYQNDEDYDGQWGIWDEPFLKRTVTAMSSLKQPFFASIFTLSSHNPYKVPGKYKGKFPKGPYQITEAIGYTDYALKQFFHDASRQTWFDQTLFIITADHTGTSEDPFYANIVGQYSIPIILYKKNMPPCVVEQTVQQIDILPTVLDYLNYDKPYYAFGKSMLSTSQQPAIFYQSPYFYCVQDSFLYVLANYEFTEAYNFKKDSLLTTNRINHHKNKELLNFCKAYIQTYTNDVIKNKTYYTNH